MNELNLIVPTSMFNENKKEKMMEDLKSRLGRVSHINGYVPRFIALRPSVPVIGCDQ